MILAKHITDLLYRYDCVIVPEFGGFITNKIGAKRDENTHTFYPPTKQITFNSHLKHNDGLLANYIAATTKISFDEATEIIKETVAKWQQELTTKTVKIATLGSLSLNDEKQIVFAPNTDINLLTSSFGLAHVNSSTITRFKEEVKPLIPIDKTTERKGVPVFIKYAATAAILLTLGAIGWNGYQQQEQQEVFAKQQKELDKKIQTATFVIDNPLPTINLNVGKAAPKNYHIIAGAFQFVENAETKVNQLKEKGFDAQIIGKNKWGLTQVTFNSFEDRLEALKALRNIKRNVSKEAWMFVNKNN